MDLTLVAPVLTVLSTIDIIVHVHLDLLKFRKGGHRAFSEPSEKIPRATLAAVVISTLLSFGIVLLIVVAWVVESPSLIVVLMIPLIDVPTYAWVTGLAMLCAGIVLHMWSRVVRRADAASWIMEQDHRLITSGPYGAVRHPSYLSYMICFIGMFLLIPSVATAVLLIGIPGYYSIALVEERLLLDHFGTEYVEYMSRTGRFIPRLRRQHSSRASWNWPLLLTKTVKSGP
ncbi:MAG: methyltransferase family protein [Candidatus Thorarchaeota archaeon]